MSADPCDLCGTATTDAVCPSCLAGTLAPGDEDAGEYRAYRCPTCRCVWGSATASAVCPVCDGLGEAVPASALDGEGPDVAVTLPPESPPPRPHLSLVPLAPQRDATAEGVAMSESTPVVSPTGAPVVSPKLVPVLVSAAVAVVTGLEYAAQSTSGTLSVVCHLAALAGGAILGIVSPGWRR